MPTSHKTFWGGGGFKETRMNIFGNNFVGHNHVAMFPPICENRKLQITYTVSVTWHLFEAFNHFGCSLLNSFWYFFVLLLSRVMPGTFTTSRRIGDLVPCRAS